MGRTKITDLWVVFVIIVTIGYVKGNILRLEAEKRSDSKCYEGGDISLSCENGYQVFIDKVYVGSKLQTSDCVNVTISENNTCCQQEADDCFYVGSDKTYVHKSCNDRPSCTISPANDIITAEKCNTSNVAIYNPNTNYMSIDYWCIEEQRVFSIGANDINTTIENVTTIYTVNDKHPHTGFTNDHQIYSFVIKTDTPNATITMHKMLLDISCNMSVHVTDFNQSEVVSWTCGNNPYIPEAEVIMMSTQIDVTITKNASSEKERFWFGFESSIPSNITILYMAHMEQMSLESSTEDLNTTQNMTYSSTPLPMALSEDNKITLYIGLAAGISFFVIFTALVVIVMYIMWRRKNKEDNLVDMRLSSEDIDKYFMVSTEYKRVTAMPGAYDEDQALYSMPNKNGQDTSTMETSLTEKPQSAIHSTPNKERNGEPVIAGEYQNGIQSHDHEPKTEI